MWHKHFSLSLKVQATDATSSENHKQQRISSSFTPRHTYLDRTVQTREISNNFRIISGSVLALPISPYKRPRSF